MFKHVPLALWWVPHNTIEEIRVWILPRQTSPSRNTLYPFVIVGLYSSGSGHIALITSSLTNSFDAWWSFNIYYTLHNWTQSPSDVRDFRMQACVHTKLGVAYKSKTLHLTLHLSSAFNQETHFHLAFMRNCHLPITIFQLNSPAPKALTVVTQLQKRSRTHQTCEHNPFVYHLHAPRKIEVSYFPICWIRQWGKLAWHLAPTRGRWCCPPVCENFNGTQTI